MIGFVLTLLVAVASVRSDCPLSTPAMLWSTSKSGNPPDLLHSDSKLVTVLRDTQMVFVFYHPVMSVEQFSKRFDVYNAHVDGTSTQFDKLLSATRDYSIFTASTVDSGERLMTLIEGEAERSNKRILRITMANYLSSPFSNDMEYVFVALPEFADEATFSTNDLGDLVSDLTAHLNSLGIGHTMVYTGLRNGEFCAASSDVVQDAIDEPQTLHRLKRQLSTPVTVTNDSYTYINVQNCLLMFTTLIQVGFSYTPSSPGPTQFINFPLPPVYSPGNGTQPLYDPISMCNPNVTGTNMTAALGFTVHNVQSNSTNANGTTLNYISMNMQFNQSGTQIYGNWYLTELSISFYMSSTSNTSFPSGLFNTNISGVSFITADTSTSATVYAPIGASYHCTTITMVPSALGLVANISSSLSVSLQMNDFQIQPFVQVVSGVPTFGDWNDCDMFFTIPILMSFFTLLIMLAILLFAFCVFSTINTYDRFDDKNSIISLGIQDT